MIESTSKLTKYFKENPIGDEYIYKKRFLDVYCNIRDRIIPTFIYEKYARMSNKKPGWSFEDDSEYAKFMKKYCDDRESSYDIVGYHYSKSLKHPVILIRYEECEFVFRYNFYNVEIYMDSKFPILLQKNFYRDEDSMFHEGIPEEYLNKEYYRKDNNKIFRISLPTIEDLFSFCDFVRYSYEVYLGDKYEKKEG